LLLLSLLALSFSRAFWGVGWLKKKKKKRKNAPRSLSLSPNAKTFECSSSGPAKKAYTPSSSTRVGPPTPLRRQNQNITAFFDYSQITNLKQEEEEEEER